MWSVFARKPLGRFETEELARLDAVCRRLLGGTHFVPDVHGLHTLKTIEDKLYARLLKAESA